MTRALVLGAVIGFLSSAAAFTPSCSMLSCGRMHKAAAGRKDLGIAKGMLPIREHLSCKRIDRRPAPHTLQMSATPLEGLGTFLDASPTPYQMVAASCAQLREEGFVELKEGERWAEEGMLKKGGRYGAQPVLTWQ
jgi:hypothetical protein